MKLKLFFYDSEDIYTISYFTNWLRDKLIQKKKGCWKADPDDLAQQMLWFLLLDLVSSRLCDDLIEDLTLYSLNYNKFDIWAPSPFHNETPSSLPLHKYCWGCFHFRLSNPANIFISSKVGISNNFVYLLFIIFMIYDLWFIIYYLLFILFNSVKDSSGWAVCTFPH